MLVGSCCLDLAIQAACKGLAWAAARSADVAGGGMVVVADAGCAGWVHLGQHTAGLGLRRAAEGSSFRHKAPVEVEAAAVALAGVGVAAGNPLLQ